MVVHVLACMPPVKNGAMFSACNAGSLELTSPSQNMFLGAAGRVRFHR